jgi:hypothetical protein
MHLIPVKTHLINPEFSLSFLYLPEDLFATFLNPSIIKYLVAVFYLETHVHKTLSFSRAVDNIFHSFTFRQRPLLEVRAPLAARRYRREII